MFAPSASAFFLAWSFEPVVAIGLALAAGLYGTGLSRVWGSAGRGAVVSSWRAGAFAAGLLAVLVAVMSPIGTFATTLFSMHMAQHLLMTMVAAPLLLLGAPLVPTLWGLPRPARRAVGRAFAHGAPLGRAADWLTRPIPALALHTLTVWAWHVPSLYEAGLRSDLVHHLQHATFLGTALLFWWPVIQPLPGRRGMSHALALLYLTAATIAQTKLLGGLITFAAEPIYPHYGRVSPLWGVSAVADQQVAGLLMLVGGFMMLGMALAIVFFVWAAREEREEPRQRAAASGGIRQ